MREPSAEPHSNGVVESPSYDSEIAIVGMAGRFPGSNTVDDLWIRVRDGDDCLQDLTADDLRAAGIDETLLASPEYVRRSGVLDGVDRFDAGFFGIGARDAAIMDPQHRLFLECTWEALESAGYVPEKFSGSIGVFAGCGANTYLFNNLLSDKKLLDQVGWFLLRHTSNDKDFLATGVSYRLDLHGPSISVQTACSTSLVAVHLAVQSLLLLECDMALAGGVTIEVPHGVGYRYHEGEILSPDGRCRAFDAASGGTVLTSGVGAVVLKRAADAVRDGDPILALVKGSAVNNDGRRKVSYLAPSIDGHSDVVLEALAVAGVDARSIGLVEAHGTGTALGDPIEFNALTQAFRSQTSDNGFCRVTSTKPNIGHLDTAAGVASLIKVIQALQNQWLPPLANYTAPSPLLDVAGSPFELSGEGRPWHSDGPRRAGVSSLGVGGTNAHVVLEEAPVRGPSAAALPEQVLTLSARSDDGLERMSDRLAEFLSARPDTPLADVAYTLSVGRRELSHRRVIVATDTSDAVKQLQHPDPRRSLRAVAADAAPAVAFLFPGGGSQYPGMGAGLDERFAEFHRVRDEGIALVERYSGIDLTPLLEVHADAEELRRPTTSLPAVIVTEIALARQWMAWGVQPTALVGHSLGEYAAAHLAGVVSFDDVIRLVVARAKLMERVGGAGAAMMAVPLPESELLTLLPETLSLAAVNANDECVVSGPADAVDSLAATLADEGITGIRIPLAAAAHSSLLDPVLDEFLEIVRTVSLQPPKIRYVSNLTGTWITVEKATDPQYWVDHLRGTVRFADGLTTALTENPLILVELGPGQSLSSYARRNAVKPVAIISGLRHPADTVDDTAHALTAFGRLWAHGHPLEVARTIGSTEGRRRLSLPTYPFERTRYWVESTGRGITDSFASPTPSAEGPARARRIDRLDDWCWEQVWDEGPRSVPSSQTIGPWLVVADASDSDAAAVVARLEARGEAVEVTSAFDPDAPAAQAARAVLIVAPVPDGDGNLLAHFDRAQARLVGDAAIAARTLAAGDGPGRLAVLTRGAVSALGTATRPIDAMGLGVALVGPREYGELQTVLVDVSSDEEFDAAAVTDELVGSPAPVVALRGARVLTPSAQRRPLPTPAAGSSGFRDGGTYLITGGLSGIGHAIAMHLASAHRANLVIVSSESLPAPDERASFLSTHSKSHPTCRRLRALAALEALGTEVQLLVADTADASAVRGALDEGEARFGHIDGAVHAAGRLVDRLLETVTPDDYEAVIGVKARGAVVLADELDHRGAELLVLVSSTSTMLAPAGQSGYVAANAALDALAGTRGQLQIVTINYGVWAGTGMAADAARRARLGLRDGHPIDHPVLAEYSLDRNGAIEFVARLDAHDWIVDEHRVGVTDTLTGTPVLPGTGHLELMLAALRQAELPLQLTDVYLHEPLVVPDDADVTVRVTLSPPDDSARRTLQVESDGGSGRSWILHSEAVASPSQPGTQCVADRVIPPDHGDGEPLDVFAKPREHVRFGPRWNTVITATRSADSVFARLSLPIEVASDASAWLAHPALVDVATACGVALAERGDSVLFVPSHYDMVTCRAPLPADVLVVARRRPSPLADALVVDLTIAGADGDVVLEIAGLTLRPVADLGGFTALPPPPTAAPGGHLAQLLELAEDLGIRPSEGVEVLTRVVASGAPRLVVSSVELDDLRAAGDSHTAPSADGAGLPAAQSGDTSLIGLVTEMWTDLLGVSPIGLDDDFFELGGHSLIAIRLMSRVHKQIGVRLQLATLFEAPTIAKLTAILLEEDPTLATLGQTATDTAEPAPSATSAVVPGATGAVQPTLKRSLPDSLVLMRDGSPDETPLFIVHGAGGNVLNLWGLAKSLPAGRQVFGLQAHGIDGSVPPDDTIESMANRYVDAIRAVRPRGPYLLGGYSGGGIVALEMSRLLTQSGDRVPRVVLLDTVPPLAAPPTRWQKLGYLISNCVRTGPASIWPWLRLTCTRKLLGRGDVSLEELDAYNLGFGSVEQFGFVNLWVHFTAVAERYAVGRYEVDVIIAKSQEVFPVLPWHYRWRGKVTGAIDTVIVPGDHFEMFTVDNAPVLARLIAPYLADTASPRDGV